MVTAKQQNEFRIQLQKKACRRAEKRIEVLEDDVSWKEVSTCATLSECFPDFNPLCPDFQNGDSDYKGSDTRLANRQF